MSLHQLPLQAVPWNPGGPHLNSLSIQSVLSRPANPEPELEWGAGGEDMGEEADGVGEDAEPQACGLMAVGQMYRKTCRVWVACSANLAAIAAYPWCTPGYLFLGLCMLLWHEPFAAHCALFNASTMYTAYRAALQFGACALRSTTRHGPPALGLVPAPCSARWPMRQVALGLLVLGAPGLQ